MCSNPSSESITFSLHNRKPEYDRILCVEVLEAAARCDVLLMTMVTMVTMVMVAHQRASGSSGKFFVAERVK